ncbi:phage scaffolding protein [Hungatella hathewayi]
MKRKFLEDMGLTKEQVDSIMAENDSDIEAAKGELEQIKTELQQTKTQLQEANTTIDGFKDYDQVKSQVEEYKTKYETSKTEYEAKIADMQFGSALEAAITAAGGRNAKAVKALLDVETLKASKDQTADIKAAIEACQKDNGYLFGATEPINNPIGSTQGPALGITKEQFKTMNYKERLDLKQNSPEKYAELKGDN